MQVRGGGGPFGGGRSRRVVVIGSVAAVALVAVLSLAMLVSGAGGPGATSTPLVAAVSAPASGGASGSPLASASVSLSPVAVADRLGLDRYARAALAVLGSDELLLGFFPTGLGAPTLPAVYYQVESAGNDVLVHLFMGWGDCPAGCTNVSERIYRVAPDGAVTLELAGGLPPGGLFTGKGPGRIEVAAVDSDTCISGGLASLPTRTVDVTIFSANGSIATAGKASSCTRGARFLVPAGVYVVRVQDAAMTPKPYFVVVSVAAGGEVWAPFDLRVAQPG